MAKSNIIIANWKMEKTHIQSIEWCYINFDSLNQLAQDTQCTIVICPTFTALAPIASLANRSHIKIGAQNCAFKESGAYTGDVSCLSLKEIGCSYCIVGHSERKFYHQETDQRIAEKVQLLLEHEIKPILCIGETKQEQINGITLAVLIKQLTAGLDLIKQKTAHLYVAYEPIWAIGSNKVPSADALDEICQELLTFQKNEYPSLTLDILYGGSINEQTIQNVKNNSLITGYLIGKASLDFQKFKNTVLLAKE